MVVVCTLHDIRIEKGCRAVIYLPQKYLPSGTGRS
jgi:hypothetical protein